MTAETSVQANPSHTYTNVGTYSVTLTVFGPLRSTSITKPNLVTVANLPTGVDLAISQFALPSPVAVESNLAYSVTITNLGTAAATSVTFTDTLAQGVSFVAASDDCTGQFGFVVCDLGTLNAGTATNLTVTVVPTLSGSITNTVSVSSAEVDSNPANNSALAVTSVS